MVLVSNEISGKIKESIESLEEQELREQDETGENVYKKLLILYILDEQEYVLVVVAIFKVFYFTHSNLISNKIE